VFDPVARAMKDAGAPAELKTRVLAALISALQYRDWDTEDESLGLFQDDPAIVEAFRRNGVILGCGAEPEGDAGDSCELERGHGGEFHEDWRKHRWPASGG
jgi:hypothetical protein